MTIDYNKTYTKINNIIVYYKIIIIILLMLSAFIGEPYHIKIAIITYLIIMCVTIAIAMLFVEMINIFIEMFTSLSNQMILLREQFAGLSLLIDRQLLRK